VSALRVFGLAWLVVLLPPALTWAQPGAPVNPITSTGLHAARGYFSVEPWEQIDTLSGNLVLTLPTLRLPGDAGFDLEIATVYNGKVSGWTVGIAGPTLVQLAQPPVTANPLVSDHTGAEHHTFTSSATPDVFFTKDLWRYTRIPTGGKLELPNGRVYYYEYGDKVQQVSRIEDRFGHRIFVEYVDDRVHRIEQTVRGGLRQLFFTYGENGRVSTITWNGRVWRFQWDGAYLTALTPPEGPAWAISYEGPVMTVTTPTGGQVSYETASTFVPGTSPPENTNVVVVRRSSGPAVSPGTWTFDYELVSGDCTVQAPDATYVYEHDPEPSAVLTSVEVWDGATRVQRRAFTWMPALAVGDPDPYYEMMYPLASRPVPYRELPLIQSTSRDAITYRTTHTYRSTDFNDCHNPGTVTETGQFTRETTYTYRNAFDGYLCGQVASVTTTTPGGPTFTVSQEWNNSGFPIEVNRYGIATTVGSDSEGNIASQTDANGHTTHFAHQWGSVQTVGTPEYTITRAVNPDGTVASETRNGATTTFAYDDLGREVLRTPPIGHATATEYRFDLREVTVLRGGWWKVTSLDGFGREIGTTVVGTSPNRSVRTVRRYDAAGRVTFEGRPFIGSGDGPGEHLVHDALGRITRRTDTTDGSDVTFEYRGNHVFITDQLGKVTQQVWEATGADIDARLAAVVDADGQTTSYAYDALDSLVQVVGPQAGTTRTWQYDAKHLLTSESHPESGTTAYTYDDVGNILSRSESDGLRTEFEYDRNNRLTRVTPALHPDYPGAQYYTTSYTYDAADNRRTAANHWVNSTFDYDDANRLYRRTDSIDGETYITEYGYDASDNVTGVTYPAQRPSGRRRTVAYDYYVTNQVRTVYEPEGRVYADGIEYQASGAFAGYIAGNGAVHTMTEDSRGRPRTISVGGIVDLTYSYDLVGNVTLITDTRAGRSQAFPLYDNLHRLRHATGPWGEVQFTYSPSGNRETEALNGAETVYVNDPATQRLDATGGARVETFLSSSNGLLRQDGLGSYSYTPTGMLSRAALNSGLTMDFGYDADRLRKVRAWSGQSRLYIHGMGDVLLSEYRKTTTSTWLRDYIYLGSRAIASVSQGPSVAFATASSTAAEPGTASITVVLTTPDGGPAAQAVVATYTTANGSATAGADYTAASGGSSVTFAAGSSNGSTQTILIPVLHDVLDEADETFLVQLGGSGAGTHTVTVADNDPPPALSVNDVSLSEGHTGTTLFAFTVSLSALSGRPVSFNYSTAAGTAAAGLDFTAVSGSVTIPAGAVSAIVSVPVVGDTLIEGSETFVLSIGAPSNATIADGQGLGTIANDDTRGQWYFAEGSTGHGMFEQTLLILNPGASTANVSIQYLLPGGVVVPQSVAVPARTRHTVRVDTVPGVTSTDNAAIVTSAPGTDIAVERSMYWRNAEQRGGHNTPGALTPAVDWYFAEGYTGSSFNTYLTIANLNAVETTVDVRYYTPAETATVVTLPPRSRHTVLVNGIVGAGLDVSAHVHSRGLPVVAERSMYWNNWEGGHGEKGITTPRTHWRFAEGALGTPNAFSTYIVLWNPVSGNASVTVRFLRDNGTTVNRVYSMAPRQRVTIPVKDLPEMPGTQFFATVVESSQPIVAERLMYWNSWIEGHGAHGTPDPAWQWWFAEGAQGTVDGLPRDTYFLVLNEQAAPLALRATFFRDDGVTVVRDYTVDAQRRFTIHAATIPELAGRMFGVTLEAITTATIPARQPFIAERAVYWGTGWYGAHASAGSPSMVP